MSILSDIGHVENPAARVKFLPIPQASPGQCGICGKGQDPRGFADPGLDFEFWGTLIFCADCAGQIAAVFGFISPADYEDLLGEKDSAQLELRETKDQLEKLRSVVDNLNNYWADIRKPVSTGTLPPDEEIRPGSDKTVEPTIQSAGGTVEPTSGGKSTSSKSTGKPGLLNL